MNIGSYITFAVILCFILKIAYECYKGGILSNVIFVIIGLTIFYGIGCIQITQNVQLHDLF